MDVSLSIVVPALVALIGIMLTWQSNKRLAQARQQSEARLRLDAAVNAANLFRPTSDPTANAARSAAGLLALTQLGQAELAVALLPDLWNPHPVTGTLARFRSSAKDLLQAEVGPKTTIGVSTETAIQVINAALMTKDPNARVIAAELLCRNASVLDIGKAIDWPSEINGKWDTNLPVAAKLLIVDALVHMALASKEINALRELAVRLYSIWENETKPRVQHCIGTLLEAILPDLQRLGYTKFMPDFGQRLISLEQMKAAAAAGTDPHPDEYFEQIVTNRSANLTQWAHGLTALAASPGKLAPASAPL
jgi:hypothetical protein